MLNLELRVNGEPFDQIDWSEASKDQKDYFWFLGVLGKCQFTATITGARLEGLKSLRLEAVDVKSGKAINPYHFHELSLEPKPLQTYRMRRHKCG